MTRSAISMAGAGQTEFRAACSMLGLLARKIHRAKPIRIPTTATAMISKLSDV